MLHRKSTILYTAIFLFLLTGLYGQVNQNSPYSKWGLGDLYPKGFLAQNSMGGLHATYQSPYMVNSENPSSLSYLKATSFEAGVDVGIQRLKNDIGQRMNRTGGFKYLSLAFPIYNPLNRVLDRVESPWHWGAGISMAPYSSSEYRTDKEEFDPNVGFLRRQFEGEGGSYTVKISNGIRYKDFSFGINIGRLIGNQSNKEALLFLAEQDTTISRNVSHSYRSTQESYSVPMLGLGLQYNMYLKRNKKEASKNEYITFGAYANLYGKAKFKAESKNARLLSTYYGLDDTRAIEQLSDTVYTTAQDDLKGKIPSYYGIGIMYNRFNQLRLGLNFESSAWSNFDNPLREDKLKDAWSFAVGGEYVKNKDSYQSYAERIRLRAGFNYSVDPRVDAGQQLQRYGGQIGFGFPIVISRQISFINLGFEGGKLNGNSIKETYGRISLGITFNDNLWFLKRRFN